MTWPAILAWVDLEYLQWWEALGLFALLALPIVLLGIRSMAGLGPIRKWVAIGLRLAVILLIVLILGGVRWQREHEVVEVLVLRDISASVLDLARPDPNKGVNEKVDAYLNAAADPKYKPAKGDRIGVISFDGQARVDAVANTTLDLGARAIREKGQSTDIAGAVQMALATFSRDAMRRIVLISDGNQTTGDIEAAIAAAAAQGVPIDVMPLKYRVDNEVIVERVVAPSWRREPDAFNISVSLLSTNTRAVGGALTVYEEGRVLERRRITVPPATVSADGRIDPRKHLETFYVPAVQARGVRRFNAVFEPDQRNALQPAPGVEAAAGDTVPYNNEASAFTFVHGQGRILYVDNTPDGRGRVLHDALVGQKFALEHTSPAGVSDDLVRLQDYDCIILNNVPLGHGGLSTRHDEALARYVHDFGGGLIMIGGPDSMGAGGWQGSKLEEVMPVAFDIPAQRQLPKGALVIIVHSCEMPNGNYWGEQCAIKAVEVLSWQDEIGVISFDMGARGQNRGINGSVWNFPLAPKGDGQAPIRAIKQMNPLDMPSFDDTLKLALRDPVNNRGLLQSKAAQKHIIVISDGDPTQDDGSLIADCVKNKISISTVSVYPHGGAPSPTMKRMADQTGGTYYGPIEKNPGQLPQIFIKEATIVRRSLIQEKEEGIPVALQPSGSDIMRGVTAPPPIQALVLSQAKKDPSIEMPLVATLDGQKIDPLFAHWQAGLGKTAVFASDAAPVWSRPWLEPAYAGMYGKFFGQMVRAIARPPMPTDLAVTTERRGDKAVISVEAMKRDAGFTNFLDVSGVVADPDNQIHEVRLVQTGPGTYTAEVPTGKPGNYVVRLQYSGPNNQKGWLVSGVAVNQSPEMRELQSNDLLLKQIWQRTRGRELAPFDPESADLFAREGLRQGSSPLPVWDLLLPFLLALVILDVACRRIAWDWESIKRAAATAAQTVRSYTTTRKVESAPTLDALKRVRDEVAETILKPDAPSTPPPLPDAKAKFRATAPVEGDITKIVGGATDKPLPAAPKSPQPKGAQPDRDHTGSLLEAKRRAREQIRKKQEE